MKFVLVSFLLLVVLFTLSCSESYDYSQASLGLGLRDYSCTEAWIEVQIGSNDKTADIYIKKNDEIIRTIKVGGSKTLLYFDDLLPDSAYKFDAVTYEDGKEVKSNPVTFTTLDTTSHNFTFETFTFGNYDNSVLYDVAIINENDIWAVGEIYVEDSLGFVNRYNAVHWDGDSWQLKKILFYYICGQPDQTPYPAKAIWQLSESKIVVALDGSQIAYIVNGIQTGTFCLPTPFIIYSLCGSSFGEYYAVGYNGNIAKNSNGNWTYLPGNTTIDLNNVFGSPSGNTIWTCGYSGDYANSVLIRIKDEVAEKIYEGSSNGQSNGFYVGPMSGVWTDNDYRVFLMTGSGLYIQKNSNEFFLEKEIARFNHGSYGIDGSKSNDIFVCGDRFVGHWNGLTYSEYPELYRQFRTYYNINTKGNIVCVVGTDYSDALNFGAIIAIGRRN